MRTIEEILLEGSKDERIFLCGEDFGSFFAYYFLPFFTYETPEFHLDMFQDLQDIDAGLLDELLWVMFRESAKTSIAKAFVVWCIAYNKKRFVNYDCYDKANAEAALFDVAVWLQTNKRIIEDFGQLYFEEKGGSKKSEMKRVSEFITTNGVKVKAYSTQQSTRGRIFDRFRPDLYIVDDFETTTTKRSIPVTQKIIEHIDEMKSGLGTGGAILYLANLISESGSVAHIIEGMKDNPRSRVRNVPVEDAHGNIMWPEKYVATDAEAARVNATISDPKKHKVSLETKRRMLKDDVYETEMKNNPAAASDIVFDRRRIDQLLEKCLPPKHEIAGFKIWEDFNPKHRYGGAADTAEGVGRDSNASGWIDFSREKPLVVATYENNRISPDLFGWELKRQGDMFGLPLLAIERNNTGHGTIAGAKNAEYPVQRLYKRVRTDTAGNTITEDIGWLTNGATKPQVIYEFKTAVEEGELEILDRDLLLECRAFTLGDLEATEYSEGMTRHFDKLMAAAIAWQMRKYALMPAAERKSYTPKPYVPASPYEGK